MRTNVVTRKAVVESFYKPLDHRADENVRMDSQFTAFWNRNRNRNANIMTSHNYRLKRYCGGMTRSCRFVIAGKPQVGDHGLVGCITSVEDVNSKAWCKILLSKAPVCAGTFHLNSLVPK